MEHIRKFGLCRAWLSSQVIASLILFAKSSLRPGAGLLCSNMCFVLSSTSPFSSTDHINVPIWDWNKSQKSRKNHWGIEVKTWAVNLISFPSWFVVMELNKLLFDQLHCFWLIFKKQYWLLTFMSDCRKRCQRWQMSRVFKRSVFCDESAVFLHS